MGRVKLIAMPNRKTALKTPKAAAGFITYPLETSLGTFFHTVSIGSLDFVTWLKSENTTLFAYDSHGVTFTVRRENKQRGGNYWIAYKKIRGKLIKRYIGLAEQVTTATLDNIADQFSKLEKSWSEQVTQPLPIIKPAQPLPDYTFSGLKGCKRVIEQFQADFVERWQLSPITTLAIVCEGRQYVMDRADQPGSKLYFQNAGKLAWWLADYVVNGRPNFATLRYR